METFFPMLKRHFYRRDAYNDQNRLFLKEKLENSKNGMGVLTYSQKYAYTDLFRNSFYKCQTTHTKVGLSD